MKKERKKEDRPGIIRTNDFLVGFAFVFLGKLRIVAVKKLLLLIFIIIYSKNHYCNDTWIVLLLLVLRIVWNKLLGIAHTEQLINIVWGRIIYRKTSNVHICKTKTEYYTPRDLKKQVLHMESYVKWHLKPFLLHKHVSNSFHKQDIPTFLIKWNI